MTYLPVDVIVDQKAKQRHRIDTLNLLAYVVLLVLVLVTRRRRLYIHETGLAIIYGMILGAALRYFGIEVTISSVFIQDLLPISVPADYVIVQGRNLGDKNATQPHTYAYEFRGELQPSAVLGSQISYASVDPEVFFDIILPPIVLNAGLSLKRRHFFRNIGAIFSYAFIGTTISVAFVGTFIYGAIHLMKVVLNSTYLADQFSLANCLYFGAIISPTDPLAVLSIFQELGVDVNLFALIFGESILNDAVSIVLTHSIDQFTIIYGRNPYYPLLSIIWECTYNFINMFITSCSVGILFGVVTALTTKFTRLTESSLLETSLVVLMSYSSFLTAEVIDVSGIVAILLCGITQAHYTINNLSFEARERIKNLFELMNFLCENYLFLAVGVSFWQRGQTWDLPFVGIAFLAVTIARAISVYPLTAILNLGRRNKIPFNFQHVIAWGGAARGVISYSLAAKNTLGDARRIMLSTTSVIVIVSVTLVGGTVNHMLKYFKIPYGHSSSSEKAADEERNLQGNGQPQWLVRPTRKPRRSQMDTASLAVVTPTTTGSTRHLGRHRNQPCSLNATPVFDVDTSDGFVVRNNDRYFDRSQSPLASSAASTVIHATHLVADPLPALVETENNNLDCTNEPKSSNQAALEKALEITTGRDIDDEPSDGASKQDSASISSTDNQTRDLPYENASLVRRWRKLDNNFIKPLLTHSQPTLIDTMPRSLRALARLLTSDEQLMHQSSTRN